MKQYHWSFFHTFPDLFWCEQKFDRTEHTPDIAYLEQRRSALLFVYDGFQHGHPEHHRVIEEGQKLGVCWTVGSYFLWKRKAGERTFPIALRPMSQPRFGRVRTKVLQARVLPIRGELYVVNPAQLITLDAMRKNGVLFKRMRSKIVMPFMANHGSYRTSEMTYANLWAHMYVGQPDYWWPRIDEDPEAFEEVDVYASPRMKRIHEYFAFTKLEYDD